MKMCINFNWTTKVSTYLAKLLERILGKPSTQNPKQNIWFYHHKMGERESSQWGSAAHNFWHFIHHNPWVEVKWSRKHQKLFHSNLNPNCCLSADVIMCGLYILVFQQYIFSQGSTTSIIWILFEKYLFV